MVRTRTTRQDGQPPVPPARATRGRGGGRGRGRGRGAARTTVGAVPADPPVAPVQEQTPVMDEPVGPAQAPPVPIVVLGLQEALAKILTACTSLAQAVSIPAVAATSQARGGAQTAAARTPEQVVQGFQTPGPPPVQPVAAAQDYVVPAMLEDEQRRLESWWEAYKRRRLVGAAPLTWQQFSVLFLEKSVPQSHREELRMQFKQLRQGDMSLTQYEMRFSELSRHAIWLVPTDRERIRRFIDGLTFQLRLLMTRERESDANFDEVVDIARQIEMVRSQEQVERESKRPRGQGGFSGVSSGGSSTTVLSQFAI
ncbi:uncharacterized protein [Nicotiana tomentosiformis]|uniref:uncharacterized protein n=1 Tax=Nicotiana tomentosiformis TaxID=4098 RepID=UPI00388CC629